MTLTPTHTRRPAHQSFLLASALFLLAPICASAQETSPTDLPATPQPQSSAPQQLAAVAPLDTATAAPTSDSLPDDTSLPTAPAPQTPAQTGKPGAATPPSVASDQPLAPLHEKYIPAGYHARPLTTHDKVLVGLGDLYSWENVGAAVLSAGYEQLLNSEPNYGTDKGAFGERLGAGALRESTQGVFTDIVFAPLFHEDNRFYQKGPSYNPVNRTIYAITRPFVTRSDSGKSTINGSLLVGYAAAAALTPAYYPQSNRNFHDTAATYGGSIGGAALGFFVNEFASDVLTALHLEKKP